jgi:hypothetical protein
MLPRSTSFSLASALALTVSFTPWPFEPPVVWTPEEEAAYWAWLGESEVYAFDPLWQEQQSLVLQDEAFAWEAR